MKKIILKLILWCLLIVFSIGCSKNDANTEEMISDSTEDIGHQKEREEILKLDQGQTMTLMVYMVGSDLEAATAAATNDMNEMLESGVDLSKVQLLVYTGGSPAWHHPDVEIPTDQHTVYELTKTGFKHVSDFEAMSMGEPESLSRFLQYGYDNYPSETYGLILWDHGNGPVMGYGSDLLYDKDTLTLPEIESALQTSPFNSENKLSFIGFDACLMASAELACTIDDYAEYMVASQEVEPSYGWNYSVLKYCGKADVPTFVKMIVEDYIDYSNAYFAQNTLFKSEVTLAAVDLSYAKELETALNTLFGEASENVPQKFNQLALGRVETRAFGRASTGFEYDLVDLNALMNEMSDLYRKESKEVQTVLEQMVLYSSSNTVESCGMSLYYPYYNKKYYETSWKEEYSKLGLFPDYIEYLENYGKIWLGTDMKEYFTGQLVASEEGSGVYTLQLNEEQNARLAKAGFYVLKQTGEDRYSVIYSSNNVTNENGVLTAKFDGNVVYYKNDVGIKGIPVAKVLDEVGGKTRYEIISAVERFDFPAYYDLLSTRHVVSVDHQTKEVTVLDFSEASDEEMQTGKKVQINPDEWMFIVFFDMQNRYLTRDDAGRIISYQEWPEQSVITGVELPLADGLSFSYEPIYDTGEEYYFMFELSDVQGNKYGSELSRIFLQEAPHEVVEKNVVEVGTLEESSIQILEQDGVSLYLELLQDGAMSQTSYCFRAVNENEFPIILQLEDFIVDDKINCSNAYVYMSVEPGSADVEIVEEITKICMLEKLDFIQKLDFSVQMTHDETYKTFINNEKFSVNVSNKAKPKRIYEKLKGAHAGEQLLLDGSDGLKVTLLGAGIELCNDCFIDDSMSLEYRLRIENISKQDCTVRIDGLEINNEMYDEGAFPPEVFLESGHVCIHDGIILSYDLEENKVERISNIASHLSILTDAGIKSHTLDFVLTED